MKKFKLNNSIAIKKLQSVLPSYTWVGNVTMMGFTRKFLSQKKPVFYFMFSKVAQAPSDAQTTDIVWWSWFGVLYSTNLIFKDLKKNLLYHSKYVIKIMEIHQITKGTWWTLIHWYFNNEKIFELFNCNANFYYVCTSK